MNVDWVDFLGRLRTRYPVEVHRILPPCDASRIQAVEAELGMLPKQLREMLRHFNGAELFVKTVPLVSILGISTILPVPPLEWAPEWYIDRLTPKWRASGQSHNDWPIAIMNYGVFIVLDSEGVTKEWDTGQRRWGRRKLTLAERMADLLREGDVYLSEQGNVPR